MCKVLVCLASISCLWVCCGQSNAQAKRLEPEVGKLPREAIGFGETLEKAKAMAIKDAAERVRGLMAMQKPAMDSFVVTEDFARTLLERGEEGDEVKNEAFKEPLKQWVMPFRTDTNWWNDVVRHDLEAQRKAVSSERQTWTSRGMLGIALLLLAAVGYVRVDEYTHRRYTTWLRIASIGVVTTVIAGWVYVFQVGW
ncbi:MAG TPA: hypothetical protein VFE62_19245 [Gemmataceae bacterium]|nr:hypothetical protein [Gemmataceae bacterium]